MLQLPFDWVFGAVLFLLLCLYSRWLTVREAAKPGRGKGQ